MLARIYPITVLLLLAACGGGGGGSGNPPMAAPSNLSYSSPQTFVVGQAITAMTPTVSGTVTGYTVSPALPAGLSLNATTGVISGTPTAASSTTTYTATASNSAGSTTANLSITVNDTAPVITYGDAKQTLTTGEPVSIAPQSTGGTVTSWSINPQLPAGLTLNSTNGTIGGTPLVRSAPTEYVITAQNSSGSATFNFTISVGSVLLDLGHASGIAKLRYNAERVLSVDGSGHWVLWNEVTADQIASGDAACASDECKLDTDLAGNSVLRRTADGFQVRSADDGHVLSTVTAPISWLKLAIDGSYIAAGSTSNLTAWSPSGTVLFTRPGDYSTANVVAAAGEVRVAVGPAGATVIERIVVPTGASTNSPAFQGQFHSWFLGGERFLSNAGNTVFVYSAQGQQADIRALPGFTTLVGQGSWFWIRSGSQLSIYAVGASSSPAATFTISGTDLLVAAGGGIGIESLAPAPFRFIDLQGSTPNDITLTMPIRFATAFESGPNSTWLIGNGSGVVVEVANPPTTPKTFSVGAARSIAASTNRIVVGTASGTIYYFNATTRAQEGSFDFLATKLELSADGTVLVASGNAVETSDGFDRLLKAFSLPSGSETYSESFTTPVLLDFTVASSAPVLGKFLMPASGPRIRQVTPLGSSTVIWSDTINAVLDSYDTYAPIRLSPDGTAIAAPDLGQDQNTGTNLIVNGTLVSATSGWPAGWIDDNRLLVHHYRNASSRPPIYLNSTIVDRSGQVVQTLVTQSMRDFQTVDANRIYVPLWNKIFSLSTGAEIWSSELASFGRGAVTGSDVVFPSGSAVRIEPY